jgi:hypothetical protein
MRFSDNGTNWTVWQAVAVTAAHALPANSVRGTNVTVRVQFQDNAGNTSATYSDYIRLN